MKFTGMMETLCDCILLQLCKTCFHSVVWKYNAEQQLNVKLLGMDEKF